MHHSASDEFFIKRSKTKVNILSILVVHIYVCELPSKLGRLKFNFEILNGMGFRRCVLVFLVHLYGFIAFTCDVSKVEEIGGTSFNSDRM
jgi:hypothetical protein